MSCNCLTMHRNRLVSLRIIQQAIPKNIKRKLKFSTPALPRLPHNVIQQQRAYASASPSRRRSSRVTESSSTAFLIMGLAGWVLWSTDPDRSSSKASGGNELILPFLHDRQDQGHDARLTDFDNTLPPNSLFSYPALMKGEKTRLLVLEPGSFQDELKCHLMTVTHLKDFHYQALSYVWGKKLATITESSSGKKIKITENLEAALRRIRDAVEPRLLWVDAICIDQSNKSERSAQVEIMQSIYTSAQRVIIWLGEGSKRDSLAFNSLDQLKTRLDSQGELRSLVRLGWFRDNKSGRVFSGGTDKSFVGDIEYKHLINLLCRDWFRRTWIIQEVASARHAVVICGREYMRWEAFAEVFMALGDHFLPVSQFGGEDARHSLENISAIENARRSRSGPLFMPLFHVLVATSFSQCTEQQDKIYAVKGLAKDWTNQKGLETNYEINAETLFKNFAVADSNRNMNLRVLSCASGPSFSSAPSLPSWVPDWRNIENAHPFVRYSDRTKYCASGGMAAEAWHSHQESILHVKGKQIDSIAQLGSMPSFTKTVAVFEITPSKIEELRRSAEWLKECQELASDGNEGGLTAQRREELWRTLTCNLTGDGFPAPKRYAEYFSRYMEFVASAPELFNDYLVDSQTSDHGMRGLNEVIPGGYENHSIIEGSIDRWSSKRRFCTTTNGALACVPKASREGDIICVLFGGEVPYVLRPTGGVFYWVIGECYVHGIMHGESLSHDISAKEFKLI
jgi:hypothetical protein